MCAKRVSWGHYVVTVASKAVKIVEYICYLDVSIQMKVRLAGLPGE